MKNLEIKAKFKNSNKLKKLMNSLSAEKKETTHQVDTYFEVPKGRMKLRQLSKDKAYVIYYERAEKTTERWSNYYTYDVSDQKSFIDLFDKMLGIKVVVDKKRILYMYQNARIHVDTVKGLGNFMEIEVEVKKGNTQAKDLMTKILEHLKIRKFDFIKNSYSDMILRKKA